MKYILILFLFTFQVGFGQQAIIASPLPAINSEIRSLMASCINIECTFINSSKSFSFDGKNVSYFSRIISDIPPKEANGKLEAMVMFIDSENNSLDGNIFFLTTGEVYIVIKVEGIKYYGSFIKEGVDFLNKFKN